MKHRDFRHAEKTVRVPGLAEPLSLELPPELAALREETLRLHKDDLVHWEPPPSLVTAEAEAWRSHGRDEDRQIWCARRFGVRLANIQLLLDAGESIVGKPLVGPLSDDRRADVERIRSQSGEMPICPGGRCGALSPKL
jgi:hypothetical protein